MTLVGALLTVLMLYQRCPMTVEFCPYGSGADDDTPSVALDECGTYYDLEGHRIYAATIMAMVADNRDNPRVNMVLCNEQDTSIGTVVVALWKLYRVTSQHKRLRVTMHLRCLRRNYRQRH